MAESRNESENGNGAGRPPRQVSFENWQVLTFYQKFEYLVVLVLSTMIAFTVLLSVWNLIIKVLGAIYAQGFSFDPTEHDVFQSVFGMIFTVIIALEFKRSLLVTLEQSFPLVQVRIVILIAILAIVRKFIILDLSKVGADKLMALAASILALGIVYWLVSRVNRKAPNISRQ